MAVFLATIMILVTHQNQIAPKKLGLWSTSKSQYAVGEQTAKARNFSTDKTGEASPGARELNGIHGYD
jgi:hypothetical protein